MELYEINQVFPDKQVTDVKAAVRFVLDECAAVRSLPAGATVAITAGSRGIANMPEILREAAAWLRERSLVPFLVPAMGSHGGATAEGQVEVLRHLGITEETVGAPLRSSMDVEFLGRTPNGLPLYMDKNACHADGILVVNRIKAHTAFRGSVESGLSKMLAIGLGKITGASFIHSRGALEMGGHIEEISRMALEKAPVLLGIGIIENGYDQTAVIAGVSPEEWHEKEAALLLESKSMMPSLPADEIDVLIIEQMGKGFSGTGMDPNILGRWRIAGVPEPASPRIKRIVILDLADHSQGNAQGIGLADFTAKGLVDKIDFHATYTNAITSTYLQRVMLPLTFATEREAIEAAIRSLGPEQDAAAVRLVQIPNTLHLETALVSPAVYEGYPNRANGGQDAPRHPLAFKEDGTLLRKITAGH